MGRGNAEVESQSNLQERRATGRTVPKPEYELQVELKSSTGGVVRGEVADISSGGVAVRFTRDAVPAVALGESASLLLTSSIFPKPVEVRAELVSRTEMETSRRYAFKFDSDLVLSDPKLHRLFNRRGAYRVAPGRGEVIDVGLRLPVNDDSQTLPVARCTDISATGIGLETDIGTDKALMDVDLVEVSIVLPGAATTQTLLAWIVHRRLVMGGVRYGLRFDAEQTREFASQQDHITTYVLRRQQEELQELAHL